MKRSILTNREKQIFNLLVLNKTTNNISDELKISEKTVRNHISNTIQKLGVKNRTQAILELIKLEQINLIEETNSIELLDDRTQVALTYRKKYPEASLKELAEIISIETGKTISKSGLNHRLRKIKELAERLAKNNNS